MPRAVPTLTEAWSHLLNRPDVLVLDTETTGVSSRSEVIDIALIDTSGQIIYQGLVLPQGRIPRVVSTLHGLTRERLKSLGAKPWPQHHTAVAEVLSRASVILAYNLRFDARLLSQTAERWAMPPDLISDLGNSRLAGRCLMREYAAWRKVAHKWRSGEWKWHTLETAYAREVGRHPRQEHRALADCRMALALMQAVAARDPGAGSG